MLPFKRFCALFFLFWALTILLYHNGYGSQFIDDYIAGIVRFMDEGWAGMTNSYEFTSLYYGHNIVFYGYYSLFGSSAIAWFLLFTGLHSLNAALAFGFVKRLFSNNRFAMATQGALLISLLFLASPYQTENVIWGATLHYAVSMVCMWGILWLYGAYLDTAKGILLLPMYLLFVFSLLTLEISLVFPGVFIIVFSLLWQPYFSLSDSLRHLKLIALPMAIIIVLYFGATYLLKGHFVGHYGSDTHMRFGLAQISGSTWQYLAKLLGFVHWMPHTLKEYIYLQLAKPAYAYAIMFLAVALGVMLYRYLKGYARFALGWILLILVLLLPVLNMYFMYLNIGENDRLSYFGSLFIYGLPVLALMWFAKRLVWVYGFVMLALGLYFLQIQTEKWHYAAVIQNLAVDSPHFYNKDGNTYLLNLPAYYNGVWIYRTFQRLHWARAYYQLPNLEGKLKYVLSSNLHNPTDSVTVTVMPEPNAYKVELSAWGNWFWNGMLGAQNRQDETLSVTIDEWGHSYLLHIPNLQPEDRLLYFTPSGWKQVVTN